MLYVEPSWTSVSFQEPDSLPNNGKSAMKQWILGINLDFVQAFQPEYHLVKQPMDATRGHG
jgi:hypothetical protein